MTSMLLSRRAWPSYVSEGIGGAASIVLITGMGGGLGNVLRDTGVIGLLGGSASAARLGIWLPIFLAVALKVAQGSGTVGIAATPSALPTPCTCVGSVEHCPLQVAITVTASIMAPLMEEAGLDDPHSRALTVVAIGAGSLVVCHVNDSMFWVFTRLLQCEITLAVQLFTSGTLFIGASAAATAWLMSLSPAFVAPAIGGALLLLLVLTAIARWRARRGRMGGEAADAHGGEVLTDSMAAAGSEMQGVGAGGSACGPAQT